MYSYKFGEILKKFSIICFLISITSFSSFSQVNRLFQLPPMQRVVELNGWIYGNQSSAIKVIDSVNILAKQKGDRNLEWYTELYSLVYSSYRYSDRSEREAFLLEKQQYFTNAPFREIGGAYYFHLGKFYFEGHQYEKAFHYFTNASNIFDQLGYRNLYLGQMFASDLFGTYYQFEDYTTALDFLKNALSCENTTHFKLFFLNNMGVTYLKMNNYPEASKSFLNLLREANAAKDSAYIGIASGNYGNVLRLEGKYHEALPYLYKDVELNAVTVHENSAITCLYIAYSLLQLDSIQKASGYLNKAIQLNPDWMWTSFRPNYYDTKALYYKKIKNFYLASLYQDSLQVLTDSLKKVFSVRVALTNTIKFNEQKARGGQLRAAMEANNLRLTRNIIISFLVLAFIGILYFIYKKRHKERLQFEEKQRDADEMLRSSQTKLDQYIHTIREKNILIDSIEIQLKQSNLNNGNGHESMTQQKDIKEIVLLTEDDWKEFKKMFSEVYPKFFDELHVNYPGLSLGEVRLLALCKLQLSSREMTYMLGISIDSLRKSRYRLRKKYPQLSLDEDFKAFI